MTKRKNVFLMTDLGLWNDRLGNRVRCQDLVSSFGMAGIVGKEGVFT